MPKARRRNQIIKIHAEINEMEINRENQTNKNQTNETEPIL